LVVLLGLPAFPVVLQDTHLGIQGLLFHRDLPVLLVHQDLLGLPVNLVCLVFLA
jgi:hypothetical protein